MCNSIHPFGSAYANKSSREKLREQQELNNEIAEAITRPAIPNEVDEDDLEQELEGLEQEAMDERMLNTGTVPVADQLNRLPATTTAERELIFHSHQDFVHD
jgi:charged multivesicular body protein 4